MTQTTKKELKPCPFCGGSASIEKRDGFTRRPCWLVMCSACWASITTMTKRETYKTWNTRTDQ